MANGLPLINSKCLIFLCLLVPSFELVTSRELGTQNSKSSAMHKLALTHRDFASNGNSTLFERMQKAVQRSNLRMQYLQASLASGNGGNFKTSVYAAEAAFVTTAAIGTPPVSFQGIVDTGSDLVWLQCKPCVHCYKSNTIFDPTSSSTYSKVGCINASLCTDLHPATSCDHQTCSYTYIYGDNTFTKGDLSYDTLTLPDSSGASHGIKTFAFGCSNDNEGGDFVGADGIIGFGQGPVSLPSQLSSGKFSYCLQTITDSASQSSPLFIGAGASLNGSNVQTTPIIKHPANPTYYYLGLKGISVGGKAVNIPAGTFDLQPDGTGGIIIDSGTTITTLATAGYIPVLEAFNSSITLPPADGSSVGLDLCYSSSGSVPSLTFHFDGADFDMPTNNYFLLITDGLFCLVLTESNQLGISIFGNIQQQNFHILYDGGAGKLSFTPATCDAL